MLLDVSDVLKNALYLLALLNPASKVMFLAAYDPPLSFRRIFELSWKSSLAALLILLLLAAAGDWILHQIFRVELYSLRITGGVIVFLIGWLAVQEGHFVRNTDQQQQQNFTDISLVPLAAPLIAGPGTITAAITCTAQSGLISTSLSLVCAIGINFLLMCFAGPINRLLVRTHLQGPLIRLTGLIIAAVAVQMIADGIHQFIRHL